MREFKSRKQSPENIKTNIEEPKNFKVEKSALTLPSKFKRMHDNKPWTYFEQDLRLYYALTTQIDAMLGRIVEHLKSENLFDNTVIIFTSDHGTHCGKHGGLIDKGFSHYEEALRTGCVIFDPRDRVKRVINNYTGLIDIYPTILDYEGAEIPEESDGHSLRALMVEEKNSWKDHAFIEFYGLGNVVTTMLTVVYNGMKYGWNATNSDELYDLINDPLETKNLIDKEEYKTKLQKLREKLYIHLKEHNNVLQYIFKIFVLQHNYPEICGDVPH